MTLIINKHPIDQNSEDSKPRHRNTRQGKKKDKWDGGTPTLCDEICVFSVFFLGDIFSLCFV
jgi:hypothetical protein